MKRRFEELEEEITCFICLEHLCDPQIFPCLHCYCKECVELLAVKLGNNRHIICPMCRSETILPLPMADFTVNRKVDIIQGRMEIVCGMCSRAKAEAVCRQCTEFICNDCVKLHGVLKIFAGHKVVTFYELKKGRPEVIPMPPPPGMFSCQNRQLLLLLATSSSVLPLPQAPPRFYLAA